MKIAICDDEEPILLEAATLISEYCLKHSYNYSITKYTDGNKLLADFSAEQYDIAFLDIYMCNSNGIKIAKQLRKIAPDLLIVFITSSLDDAINGYAVQATHYLLKPIVPSDINEALDRCCKIIQQPEAYILAERNNEKFKIPLKHIIYIEVIDKKCFLTTTSGTYESRSSISYLEDELKSHNFYRCHRSFIVNFQQVLSCNNNGFKMKNNVLIPIRNRGVTEAKKLFTDFLFELVRSSGI